MVFALDKSYSEEEEEQTKNEQYQGGVRAVARTPKKKPNNIREVFAL